MKKTDISINRIKTTLQYMEDDLKKELIRESQKRRRSIDKGFDTLYLHLRKLDIDTTIFKNIRGVFYNPNHNFECFKKIKEAFEGNC